MTDRLALRPLGLAALLVGAVVAGFLLLARGGDGTKPIRAPQNVAVVRGELSPRSPAFGDRLVADIAAVVDTDLVVPASIQVSARFDPYEQAAPLEVDVAESGRLLRVRYRFTLECLSEACTPSAETQVLELPPSRLIYRYRGSRGPAAQTIRWAPLRVTPRVEDADLRAARWRADPTALTAPSYRISPVLVASVLVAAALGLLLAAGALGRSALGTRTAGAVEVEADTRPPLERALERAHLTSLNGSVPERRKAVERVARELAGVGLRDLADRARTIAWSPGGPTPDAVAQLDRDARAATGGTPS